MDVEMIHGECRFIKETGISCTKPDWSREHTVPYRYEPSKQLLRCIRQYDALSRKRGLFSSLIKKIVVLRYRFWSAVTGADIPLGTTIGGGLVMLHPNGIVIHPDVMIGPNCMIFQGVTIGTRGIHSGVPKLGGHVDVGPGAKILGSVSIGDHAQIGANAVVLTDVPPGASAVGVPARIIPGN
jgi:serine O-acetyltransferase